jgi:hypothetical protein
MDDREEMAYSDGGTFTLLSYDILNAQHSALILAVTMGERTLLQRA